jgi:L-alanine-DL-glutamate epimerase-like enolase superfamily enzyme
MDFQIQSLSLYELSLPYNSAFRPPPEIKRLPTVLWLRLETNNGQYSFGEICLNYRYINETTESVRNFISEHHQEWQDKIHGLDDLIAWISQNKLLIDQNPAAFSCLESAVLHGIAQQHQCSVAKLLGINNDNKIRLAALLQRGRPEQFMLQLTIYEQHSFSCFKVELDGNFKTDNLKLNLLASTGYDHVQIDARNIWSSPIDLASYIKNLPLSPYSIENPFNKIDHEMLIELSNIQSSRVVLDESILTTHNTNVFKENSERFIVNLRISRLGGLLRTLNMMQHAKKLGFDIIIGSVMGETDLSQNISKLAAIAAGDRLVSHEGAFEIYMLNTDMYKLSLSTDINDDSGIPQFDKEHQLQYIKRIS